MRRFIFYSLLFMAFSSILSGCGGGGGSAGTTTASTDVALPVAIAGANQSVYTGTPITLEGNASYDQEGKPLSYAWSLTSKPIGSSAAISNVSSINAMLIPDIAGDYTVQLIVNNGKYSSGSDTMVVSAVETGSNRIPVANAGEYQSVPVGTTVTLDGAGSFDPDGDQLTYKWSFVSGPDWSSTTQKNLTKVNANITSDLAGCYTMQLIVNDGSADSKPDTIEVTNLANGSNHPPIARAGDNQIITIGSQVMLDGSNSYDPDNDQLTYFWYLSSQPAGSSAYIVNTNSVTTNFIPDIVGSYYIYLIVKDGSIASEVATTKVTVTGTTGISSPTVSTFTIPATSSSLTVSITQFTATDAVGVSGYTVTESSTAPLASASGWTAYAPTSYTFASEGNKTLYAWAKNAAGLVSTSKSASIVITLTSANSVVKTITGYFKISVSSSAGAAVQIHNVTIQLYNDNSWSSVDNISAGSTNPSSGSSTSNDNGTYLIDSSGNNDAYISKEANGAVFIGTTQFMAEFPNNTTTATAGIWLTSLGTVLFSPSGCNLFLGNTTLIRASSCSFTIN
ncbi:MAG: PKD domain-containing protein [Proteobacteria bacterium]|nr:PKD domain-containing protein [Pseudomonadota bacterium]MBU1687972.1 PKD domain-containing protein [Pseudomonadota bacterium]